MLELAAGVAKSCKSQNKTYRVGAVAIRARDGVIVKSFNGITYQPFGDAHAESRVLKKAGLGCTLFVARVTWKDGSLAMSRPCCKCYSLLKGYQVSRCFYTIDNNSYGIIEYKNNSFFERVKYCEKNRIQVSLQ